MTNEKVIQVIFDVVDDFNEQHPETELGRSGNTVLFGKSGKLDSLGLVSFIVATEQRLEEVLGISLTLADERAMSQKNSPFRTIGTLAEYISKILNEGINE